MPAPSADLLSVLRPDQVTVRLGGNPFVLQATVASHWLGAIALDMTNLAGIVPGLVADEDLDLMQSLANSLPDIESRWLNCARVALGRAGGRDWWWTLNLSRKALSGWIYINGILVRQGVHATKESFPDWLDACYTLLWERADEEQQIKLDMELSAKPRGVALRSNPSAVRQMLSDFAAD